VFTADNFNAWTDTTNKSQYVPGASYYLSYASTVAGNIAMPDPYWAGYDPANPYALGQNFEDPRWENHEYAEPADPSAVTPLIGGNTGSGVVRVTYLGQ
jgi:hypothetical protein